ncbi:hypothetical protein ACFQYP_64945 [Nonomuraea antimicrobica]
MAGRGPDPPSSRHPCAGVIITAADDIAARWHDGGRGHVSLLPYRDRQDLGGLVHVAWENGDACWTRVDVLELVDQVGIYRVQHRRLGVAPVQRLAVRAGEPYWWRPDELPDGLRWAGRHEPFAQVALVGAA